ncbi:flagellar biosynthesis protein FlhA [Bradyrhizobium sp. HKCCYLRH3059]|nr:flagellar biosynthesis protein FlhA [Bradyrhizobium sp. SZCCHNRI2009]
MTAIVESLTRWSNDKRELLVVILIVSTIMAMILPIPTALVDVMVSVNIGASILLLMVAFYLNAAVEFSALPAIILISTVFRLSISITITRLVLSQADAGSIVQTFGEFVVSSNVVVGLVVFLIITIVQFVVITKGSERVAEVAARFTLDALPGKQMSIDADLRNGDINQAEARRRRRRLERESQLYGAMDGAMKFVKGDAIAGLIIIAVNLVGGIVVGTVQHRLRISEAIQLYSLLTIGDGLVSQVPALFVSMAAGTVVTRVATEAPSNLGSEIMEQITSQPQSLQLAGLMMLGLAFVPGFPAPIFLFMATVFGGSGVAMLLARRRAQRTSGTAQPSDPSEPTRSSRIAIPAAKSAPIMILAEAALCDELRRAGIHDRIRRTRQDVADWLGCACPGAAVDESSALAPGHFRIELHGVPLLLSSGELDQPTTRTAGGAAISAVDAELRRVLVRYAPEFLGIQETKRLLNQLEADYADLVREALRVVPTQRITDVLRRLLDERVSIRNLRLILETLAEWGMREQSSVMLVEHVRLALRRQICFESSGFDRTLRCFVLDRQTEEAIRTAVHALDENAQTSLDPAVSTRLLDALTRQLADVDHLAASPSIVLASADLRRVVWTLLAPSGLNVVVLSYQEISKDFRVEPIAVLGLDESREQAEPSPIPAMQ